MKKLILATSIALLGISQANAQVTKTDEIKKALETTNKDTVAWVHGGVLNIGANEGFLHNWAAGGELASMTVNGIFSGYLNRIYHRVVWSNNLDMTYGLNYTYSSGFKPRKTDDRIDFTSKYGINVDTNGNFFFTGLFNFKSQFTKGYDYSLPRWDTTSTSKFFSPAYFTVAVGMEYREGTRLSLFLSPAAGRLTLVDKIYTQGEKGAFGVPQYKTSLYQFGAYFSGRYVWEISKSTVFKTRADLYCNYLAKDTKNDSGMVIKKDNPGNISILFDNLLSYKISKYFNMTVGLTMIYDNNNPYSKTYVDATGASIAKNEPGEDLGWLQLKQIFTFGLEYKFH